MSETQEQKFALILADPPWQYRNYTRTAHGAASAQYDTMPTEAIAAVPVQRWAADDCILSLWGTWAKADACIDVMRRWGFEYVTGIPWVKSLPDGRVQRGVGFWTQSASEFVLFGKVGNPKRFMNEHKIGLLEGDSPQFYAERGRHSQKPEAFQAWLEKSFTGPYLELFAARPRPGWTTWGKATGFVLSSFGVARAGKKQTSLDEAKPEPNSRGEG